MPLTSGTRLGPYEVTAQIGVGGMGEVYRATDTNLGRDVAIKVLPGTLAHGAERLASGLGSAVASDVFVASLFETTSNIWMTTIGPAR